MIFLHFILISQCYRILKWNSIFPLTHDNTKISVFTTIRSLSHTHEVNNTNEVKETSTLHTSFQPITRITFYDILQASLISIKKAWELYYNHRINANISLIKILATGGEQTLQDVYHLISRFEAIGRDIRADTAHILIQHCFRIGQAKQAQTLFHHFFVERRVAPSNRSLNIMIEGFRTLRDTSTCLKYASQFPLFGLQADNYTVSSLVRLAETSDDIVRTLNQPALQNGITVPVVRCVVETLGRLGSVSDALRIATTLLTGDDSIYSSRKSGDALLIALIQADEMKRTTYLATDNNHSFVDGSGLDVALRLWIGGILGSPPIAASGKGACALFTGLQRELRQLVYTRLLLKGTENDKNGIRIRIVQRIQTLKEAGHKAEDRLYSLSIRDLAYLLNGRLCDAILRTRIENSEEAKSVWLRRLLPLIHRIESLQTSKEEERIGNNSIVLEAAEKSFEALMFLSGFDNRPDIGLEVARTARRRNFPSNLMQKLATSYSRGRNEKLTLTPKTSGSMNLDLGLKDMATESLERGMESELGILLDTNMNKNNQLKSIRLQLSPPDIKLKKNIIPPPPSS